MRRALLTACALGLALGAIACHSNGPTTEVNKVAGSLSLTLSPSIVSLAPGETLPVAVILDRPAGFAGPVTVSVSGLPGGVSASALTITANMGTFNLAASGSAAFVNNAAVMVTGASLDGTLSAAGTLTLTIASPDAGFSLNVFPLLTLTRGAIGSTRVNVIRHNFGGVVTVTVLGLPDAGVTVDPLSIAGSRGDLVFRTAPNAIPGSSPLTVLGVSGSAAASAHLTLTVLDPGGLDESFGAGSGHPGYVTTNLGIHDRGGLVSTNSSDTFAVATDPDGKILVALIRTRLPNSEAGGCGPTHSQTCKALALTRYNSDGTLDATFGGQDAGTAEPPPPGVAIYGEGPSDPLNPIYPLPQALAFVDGGILVASGASPGNNVNPDTLLRFTENGLLDTTFNPDSGTPGRTAKTINTKALRIMEDGSILVAGTLYPPPTPVRTFALAQFNSDGTLNREFGDAGVLLHRQFDGGPTVAASRAIISEQAVKVIGFALISARNTVAIMSFNLADGGSIDEAFNGDGQGLIQLGSMASTPVGAVDFDGGTVIVANAVNERDIAMVSYQSDGGLDVGFGDGGIARTQLPPDAGTPNAAAAAAFANRIVVAGSATVGNADRLLIARYNSDGSLDQAFGQGQTGVIINVPAIDGGTVFKAVTVQPDGKIVAVGYTGTALPRLLVVRYLGSTSETP